MKNVSRSKFLLCFRPVVDMDLMLESKAVTVDGSQNRGLTYVGVKHKEDMKPSTTSSVTETENSILIHRTGKKTFSQVIKAVVFEILLAKRVRDRKGIDPASYSSNHDFTLSSRDKMLDSSLSKSVNKIQDTILKSNSVSSISSCSSSSSSPSSSPNSTLKTKGQKMKTNNTYGNHQQHEMKPNSSSSSAIFLLLVSLAVTIFWGKICAILFTSIWLYFLSRQQPAAVIENLESIKRSPEKKSSDYKRKVIMEGILERNHNRARGAFNF